jgi:hypothetical protein
MKNSIKILLTSGLLACVAGVSVAQAEILPNPGTDIITQDVISEIKSFLNDPVVEISLNSQNAKRSEITQAQIDQLDKAWRSETSSDDQPLIAAALGSPISTYLLRMQAASKGLYSEIFIMDLNGLNVGQSSITSDYWQGDEDKVLKTLPKGVGTIFIDQPEFNDEFGIWLAQVNLTLDDNGTPIGVSTVEVNLTELQRRQNMKAN